jgi:plastocyanin
MLKRLLMTGLTVGLSAFATMMVACGDDESNPDAIDEESEGVGSDENTNDYTIIATDFAFSTDHLEVDAGDVIFELDNQGSATHTLSIYRDEDCTDLATSTGNVDPGVNFEHPASLDVGDYFVRCDVHPSQMEMTMTAIDTP